LPFLENFGGVSLLRCGRLERGERTAWQEAKKLNLQGSPD